MLLTKIRCRNYRLLIDTELNIHKDITLIVGRNNTAKTSCMDFIGKVLGNKALSYDDYPIQKRKYAYVLLSQFIRNRISYEKFCKRLPTTSIEFSVDYSLDDPDDNLGALSPFIIDVDLDTTTALIKAEYKFKMDENSLRALFHPCFYKNGIFTHNYPEIREICSANFIKLFELSIYAINPKDINDIQIKSQKELSELFPFYPIPAERVLGEAAEQNHNSLGGLINSYFSMDIEKIDPEIKKEVLNLRNAIDAANMQIQRESSALLSTIVEKSIGFGYPNGEELQLGVNTKLQIDNQIKDQAELTYTAPLAGESLPSSHNGLGYKNLIKMEFQLADFSKKINNGKIACIPLLFIEEPESHMHPQMQNTFASYLQTFVDKISDVHIQTFLTSHSAHIANTIDFSNIRYAQKTLKGVIYKDLNSFGNETPSNIDFIKKYLTLSRCDLFFADKVIFVEGASERLLIPDMIEKCDKDGCFDSQKYKLSAQYYALIEIGGAYAYKFIPFVNFLGIPCLIITDIDSMKDGRTTAVVSKGKTTSNSTLKWWIRQLNGLSDNDKTTINLKDIINLTSEQKTQEKCHIEFQVKENGLCGRSLEEAIRNVNRAHYKLTNSISEDDLEFKEKSKTDFALKLICDYPDYKIPKYIKDGLIWLNEEKVLV